MVNQLTPINEPYSPEIANILENYPQQDGYILQLFRAFANSVRFLQKAVPNLLDKESPLALRIREIVILRVTANNNCEYEWGVHVAIFAKHARFSQEQIAATKEAKADASCWTAEEQNLIGAVDDLCSKGKIQKNRLNDFQTIWSQEQQLEILALAGTYHTISFVANTALLNNEPFAARFPKK